MPDTLSNSLLFGQLYSQKCLYPEEAPLTIIHTTSLCYVQVSREEVVDSEFQKLDHVETIGLEGQERDLVKFPELILKHM